MKYSIQLAPYPKDKTSNRDKPFEWCVTMFGNPDYAGGTWGSDFEYSKDNRSIIETFEFDSSADASLFALKWV